MQKFDTLEYIKLNDINTIEELAKGLEISTSTARRRLQDLQAMGLIKLIRGGTFEICKQAEGELSGIFKVEVITLNQQLAGCIAAQLIKPGDTVFIDNGSTVREILKHVSDKEIKIYSNGIRHLFYIKEYDIELNIIPGRILKEKGSVVGVEAENYIRTLEIDKAFIGASGYDENGIYCSTKLEKRIKQIVLKQAKKSYVVVDSRKLNLCHDLKICDTSGYQLITERTI